MAQWDIANSDVIVVMGSNMAENHPIAFRFALQAKAKGATLIHVDPRFTRTSALCDIHAPIRAGTDIAFLGGIIHYLLERDLWFRDWAMDHTNIAQIIEPGFTDAATGDGLFSGWNEEKRSYKFDTWQPQGVVMPSALTEHYLSTSENFSSISHKLLDGPAPSDPTLRHPNCVYQILKRQYAAYTPAMVAATTGCTEAVFVAICEALARNSGRERTGAFCYAVGWTHHSTGVQMIRACAVLQALLGNIGRPGGGILALRGHTSIQGSTDIPTLYNMMPGYLPQPHAQSPEMSLAEFLAEETVPTGWWHNFPKYFVSLLKAFYGEAAQRENDFGFHWVPKIVGDHSQLPMTMAMADGTIRGMLFLGQNPVVGGSNADTVARGLARLEWMVVRDMAETETAGFWHKGRLVQRGETRPEEIGTEVFLLPAALSVEKEGTVTNTHRLVQFHDKLVEPPGDCRSDLWFVHQIGRRLQRLYADSEAPEDQPIRHITLDYGLDHRGEPAAEDVLREINGYEVAKGRGPGQVKEFTALKDDGSTACGCWLYCGAYPEHHHNQARSRKPDGPDGPGTHLGWAFAWPANRRTLYNRASADAAGNPWSERKKLVWWDAATGDWKSPDALDFEHHKPPGYRPDWSKRPSGMDAIGGDKAFIMLADGNAALFVSSGLKDGPLPVHYEPIESPVHNPLHAVQSNPAAFKWGRDDNPVHEVGDPRYPHVLTTYRLTEHHSGAIPTRMVPHLAELQPEGFAEIPTELARDLGIATLDWVVLSTARGEVETRALVTDRLQPFAIAGRRIHQLGMPWHFGWAGYATGDIANALTAVVGDPNTSMHENKALTCALRRGRIARPGPAAEADR